MLKVEIKSKMRPAGIEPTATAWKAVMLPLHQGLWILSHIFTITRCGNWDHDHNLLRTNDWFNQPSAYLQQQSHHSDTNIHSAPVTWNQWFYLHWYYLILSYQYIRKPLTLQWCPIGDTDPLHQFVASNLEKQGCPKHMVTYG